MQRRITSHPVLPIPVRPTVPFTWTGRDLVGHEGEAVSSALLANGVRVLGRHARDGSPRGLFCANGHCAQCLVLVDGRPVKACVTPLRPGARVEALDGPPVLPLSRGELVLSDVPVVTTRALVIGAGPAGLSAALELGQRGVETLVLDDRPVSGGKLVLQTHRFFGSFNAVHAGTRGIDIARRMVRDVLALPSVRIWNGATAAAVFSDGTVGVVRGDGPDEWLLVRPEVLVVATGARERSLSFPGNGLPGVMGAGAFQTLLHRDLVRPASRVLVVGGGNVGLIVAYQAVQAGVAVAAVVEVRATCGGYRVHRDKLARHGVPIFESHTIVAALGGTSVEAATIAPVDERFHPRPGGERTLRCDAVLLALGFEPENELYAKARELGLPAFSAGDAREVAEASAAMFAGRIEGVRAARALGAETAAPDASWARALAVHRARPGPIGAQPPAPERGVVPVLHCVQEIPCDPCSAVCPQGGIVIDPDDIRSLPRFALDSLGGPGPACIGCDKCVVICPGQAITLVDYRSDPEHPTVVVPWEMPKEGLRPGATVTALDVDGQVLGDVEVVRVREPRGAEHTASVKVRAPRAIAQKVAGVRIGPWLAEPEPALYAPRPLGDAVVCRCEHVTAEELRMLVRAGHRDVHTLKVLTRIGMGACGARTCWPLVREILIEEGVPEAEIEEPRRRPLLVEVPLGVLAGAHAGPEGGHA